MPGGAANPVFTIAENEDDMLRLEADQINISYAEVPDTNCP